MWLVPSTSRAKSLTRSVELVEANRAPLARVPDEACRRDDTGTWLKKSLHYGATPPRYFERAKRSFRNGRYSVSCT